MGEAPQTYTILELKGKKAILDGFPEAVSVLPKETVIQSGAEIRGWLNPEGKWGPYLKIAEDRSETSGAPQPRTEQREGGGFAKSSGAAHREAFFDERSARIERQHSQEMALRLMAAFEPATDGRTAKAYRDVVKDLTDWFVADLDNASSEKVKAPPPAITAQPTTGEVASDKGPERHSVPDPPPPTSDTAESVQADASQPLTPSQKGEVTKALNASPIAKQHHDTLRAWYGADRVDGARELWKALSGLDNGDVDAFLTQHGITPASDVPVDDEGLPSAEDLEKRAAELGVEVMEG